MTVDHVIDPQGEVILIVRNPNPPFAVWTDDKAKVTPANGSNDANDTSTGPSREPSVEPSDTMTAEPSATDANTDGTEKGVHIQVSAKHLTFGSPVFNSMLNGDCTEAAEFKENGSVQLVVPNWDVEALLLVLHIMHAQTSKVPRLLSLEDLAKVTFVADYYDVKEVKLCCDLWIWVLRDYRPSKRDAPPRDVVLWIWVSYFARRPDIFATSCSKAMEQLKSPISSLGLPIPAWIIDEINRRRTEAIQSGLDLLYSRRVSLLDIINGTNEEDGSGCTVECAAMTYGQMSKGMRAFGMLPSRPDPPFTGVNNDSFRVLSELGCGYWGERRGPYTKKFKPHKCSTSSNYSAMFDGIYHKVEPLSLSDYIPKV